jgi:hypothetical protein
MRVEIMPTLANVLDEFADQMLNYFPKVLSPGHIIEHCIELESRL